MGQLVHVGPVALLDPVAHVCQLYLQTKTKRLTTDMVKRNHVATTNKIEKAEKHDESTI